MSLNRSLIRWATALFAVAAIIVCVVLGRALVTDRPAVRTDLGVVAHPRVHRVSYNEIQVAATNLSGGVGLDQLRPDRTLGAAWQDCRCSISGLSAASIATMSCPTWRSSKRSIRMSSSSSASIPASLTPNATPRISAAKSREYRIKHPVINDAKMTIWNRFAVNSWPTIVLIDTRGIPVAAVPGEGNYDVLDREIGQLVAAAQGPG